MNYPEKLVIRRPSGTATTPTGAMNLNNGTWLDNLDEVTTKDTSVVCTTRCDAQDWPVVLEADPAGKPMVQADVTCFLMIERVIDLIKIGDLCDVTWEDGTEETLVVLKVARLDASIFLRRTGQR